MSATITSLEEVPLAGSCILADNALTTASNNTITFPSTTSTLATAAQVSSLESRVNGARGALVFDTQADMNTFLADSTNTATLTVGQNLYIRELDVPDYWWDGTQACELETQKVNLTEYVTLTGTETLTNKTLTTPTISQIKKGSYTLTLPSKTGTLATTSDLSSYVTLTGTQTLTNKTLTTPTISQIKNGSYTITLPSETGTLLTNTDVSAIASDVSVMKSDVSSISSNVSSINSSFSSELIKAAFPVGAVIERLSNTNPRNTTGFAGTTWSNFATQTLGSYTVYYWRRTA